MASSFSPSRLLSPKSRKHCVEATRAKVSSSKKVDWLLPPPQPGKQTEMFNCPADVLICGGAAGSSKAGRAAKAGKAIRDGLISMEDALAGEGMLSWDSSFDEAQMKDSKVLSWSGKWIDFSDIKVGDKIMNPDGQYQEVLQVHDRGMKQFYRVSFEDGTSTECCGEHLWAFWEARCNSRRKSSNGINLVETNLTTRGWNTNYITRARIRDTEWLMKEVSKGRRFIIPINAPLQFTALSGTDASRAYFYGCLIGDGYIGEGGRIDITTCDQFIADKLIAILGEDAYLKYEIPAKDGYLERVRVVATKVEWAKAWVRNNQYKGKRAWEKSFPGGYLSAPLDFRYAFAQGLFDTDGTVGNESKRNVSYCTTSKELANQVASLVRSLGYMAKIVERHPKYTHKGERLDGRTAYNVHVEGNHLELLFSLPRKVERAKAHGQFNGGASWPGKRIVSIEPTEIDYARCITVSNPNHLYITDDFIVTHNSFFLLLDAAKQEAIQTPGYNGVFFRRSYPQLTNSGCLVPESQLLYREIGGRFTSKPPTWRWATGSELTLRPLQHEDSVYDYMGAQFCWLGFDELTHFTRNQFFYMLSRNRSGCGIKPRVRATCNPDADSWVADFIQWWWNPETGLPIHERSGVIRYFLRFNDVVYWGDTKQELIEEHREKLRAVVEGSNGFVAYDDMIKSFTFIAASIYDNPALLRKNPEYVANLNSLHEVERQRLLFGNWKIRYEAGLVFSGDWFKIIDYNELPCEPLIKIRFWDLAATSREDAGKKTCSTAGCLMAMIGTNIYILDLLVFQRKAGEVLEAIKGAAIADGTNTKVRYELEGGASSKILESDFATELQSINRAYDIKAIKPDKSKLQRAIPLATQAQLGHVFLIRADWNGQFLSAVESFDGLFKATVNDIVDSATGAYEQITNPQNAIIISSNTSFVGYLPQQSNQNRYI